MSRKLSNTIFLIFLLINYPIFCQYQTSDLIEALSKNNFDQAKSLILNGADINKEESGFGQKPLHLALCNPEIVKLLIEKGADVNSVDFSNNTPLIWNASIKKDGCNNLESAKILIQNGANLNAKNKKGINALMKAAEFNNSEIAEILLLNGINVNEKSDKGRTAINFGIYHGDKYIKFVNVLLKYNVDINIVDPLTGKTVLEYAQEKGYTKLVKLLKNPTPSVMKTENQINPSANEKIDKKIFTNFENDKFLQEVETIAKEKHPASNIENTQFKKRKIKNQSEKLIEYETTYEVILKGSFLGINKYKVGVTVQIKLEKLGSDWDGNIINKKVIYDIKEKAK